MNKPRYQNIHGSSCQLNPFIGTETPILRHKLLLLGLAVGYFSDAVDDPLFHPAEGLMSKLPRWRS